MPGKGTNSKVEAANAKKAAAQAVKDAQKAKVAEAAEAEAWKVREGGREGGSNKRIVEHSKLEKRLAHILR